MNGKVKFFAEEKNFGFIIGDDDLEYFVHGTDVTGEKVLQQNQEVTFEGVEGQKGIKAINVEIKITEG